MATGKLTALKIRSLTAPGRYGDGGGLWLQVRGADTRSWLFRYTIEGRARQMGLGRLADVSLAEAREAAGACRKQMHRGADPIDARAHAQTTSRAAKQALTFLEAAERYIAAHEASWRNPKHRAQWSSSLARYAFPLIGRIPIGSVGTAEVMQVIEPIWATKAETAARVRGRIETILDFAKAREWRTGDNPARWRGHVANMLPTRNKARTVQHHPALPWREIGPFMVTLRAEPGTAALALRFVILTAARTSEAIGATWAEINLENATWTVPAERMKANREHRVPLSPAAIDVLRMAATGRTDQTANAFVFPGTRQKTSLSNMSMAMLLRRIDRPDVTVHGFRSCFRDWAAEATTVAREVAEAALAHTLENKVEAAYRRGDLFGKRRGLMEDWAIFCVQSFAKTAANKALAIEARP